MNPQTIGRAPQQAAQEARPKAQAVRRLLPADPCPCASAKPFSECCCPPLKEGWTPELALYMVFTAPPFIEGAPGAYAIQTAKLSGEVPADEVVANIRKVMLSPPVQRTLAKLNWLPNKLPADVKVVDMGGPPLVIIR